jgi:uncharacterized protein (DUF58 family)
MINAIFDLCVRILLVLAGFFGMTYKAINVWIFIILWPIITLFLIYLVFLQHRTIRRLKLELSGGKPLSQGEDHFHTLNPNRLR